jgi:protein TonB
MKATAYQKAKLQYRKRLELGTVISLFVCVMLLQGFKSVQKTTKTAALAPLELVQTDAVATRQQMKKPIVEPPRIPVPGAEEDMIIDEPLSDWWDPTLTEEPGLPEPPEEEPVFVAVEHPAEPIGGFGAILDHLEYPKIAKQAGIQGRVVVFAKIDRQGKVVKTLIHQSFGFEPCDLSAMKAVQATVWKPALQRDEPVSVWVSIPIDFRLR